MNTYDKLIELYNSKEDNYHIIFLDEVSKIIPNSLLDLYYRVLDLSLEAPFNKEIFEDYQLTLELLCKALGFKFDTNGKIKRKRDVE